VRALNPSVPPELFIKIMRPRFEKDLKAFADVAKDETRLKAGPSEGLDDLAAVLNWHLEKAAERQHTNVEIQRAIYDIQKEKQQIMQHLKEQLACLDNPECQIEQMTNGRLARFDEASSAFRYADDNGREQIASFGELMTDLDWGINYNIDHTAPRLMIKKYLIERARQRLGDLLDRQIIRSEVGGDIAYDLRQKAYTAVEEDRKSGKAKERWGFISEMIVKNFLKKLSLDKNLPFEIHEADIFQDVEQKIDFIIHRKEKLRGVNVETDEKTRDVGIQFSVVPRLAQHKRRQVERSKQELRDEGGYIQDIALVIFPLTIANVLKGKWQEAGRPAGGPSKFLNRNVAEKLFSKLLKDIFAQEEIKGSWQTIQDSFPE